MFRAVLFDLDGTLIKFDPELFVKTYLSAAGKFFADLVSSPTRFAEEVLKSTLTIEMADVAETTVIEDFLADFCPKFHYISCKIIKERFEEFYKTKFDVVKPLIQPIEGAAELVQKIRAKRQDIKIVLATNPVFPKIAIEERMKWGGLQPEWFDLITHAENFHYCKRNLKYWDEILEKIDVTPNSTLVVGNDVKRDLVAKRRGLKTFLVEDTTENGDYLTEDIKPDFRGKIKDLERIVIL